MICPTDREQMVNFTVEPDLLRDHSMTVVPLPSGGISNDEVYETWYVYECPKCGRRVKEAYRCEVLLQQK
jgi:hypothetical protein